jgi:hypothetical protein
MIYKLSIIKHNASVKHFLNQDAARIKPSHPLAAEANLHNLFDITLNKVVR